MTVAGIPIHCHKKDGHGSETFEEGLQNSCNPVFMNVADRIGKEKFYEYFEAFGCMDKTNIDLPGEASSIYHSNLAFGHFAVVSNLVTTLRKTMHELFRIDKILGTAHRNNINSILYHLNSESTNS
jgi:hypothetical protein